MYKYNKNKTTVIGLSKMFIIWEEGKKIPTIQVLERYFCVARGTIQNCIKKLIDDKAIELEQKGSQGTILISKNFELLLANANINRLIGALPIPDTSKTDDLSKYLKNNLIFEGGITNSLVFTRNARERLDLIRDAHLDYAVISKFSAQIYQNSYNNFTVIKEFGNKTMYSGIELIFSTDTDQLYDEIRVGIAEDSYDQFVATKHILGQYNPRYIKCEFLQLNEKLLSNEFDVLIRAKEFITENISHLKSVNVDSIITDDMTNAVIVVNKERLDILYLMNQAFEKIKSETNYSEIMKEQYEDKLS